MTYIKFSKATTSPDGTLTKPLPDRLWVNFMINKVQPYSDVPATSGRDDLNFPKRRKHTEVDSSRNTSEVIKPIDIDICSYTVEYFR